MVVVHYTFGGNVVGTTTFLLNVLVEITGDSVATHAYNIRARVGKSILRLEKCLDNFLTFLVVEVLVSDELVHRRAL